MKNFFGIVEPFRIERADIAALCMMINVILVIFIGFPASWFGLTVACVGLFLDLRKGCHINAVVMRISAMVLNIYFLTLYY